MSLHDLAAEREKKWNDYGLPEWYLGDFALSELVGRNLSDYSLPELFSPVALGHLLKFCVMSANATRAGVRLVSFGPTGGARDIDEGRKLEQLLFEWAQAGWIDVSVDGDKNQIQACLKG